MGTVYTQLKLQNRSTELRWVACDKVAFAEWRGIDAISPDLCEIKTYFWADDAFPKSIG